MSPVNNFDLLRLIFASMVVVAHCSELSGAPALRWIPEVLSQRMAVEGFFTMSGCLVVASYERSSSLRQYFEKRARRILPLYWFVLIFGMILGATVSTVPLKEFALSSDVIKYVAAQFTFANFLHPTLPGVFTHNLMTAVNGSLWTIKIEVMFYMIVPVIAFLCVKLGRWQVLSTIFLLSCVYRVVCERSQHDSLAVQLPGQLSFFVVGAAVYYYFPWIKANTRWVWLTAIAAYIAYLFVGSIAFRALGISLTTLCCGLFLPPWPGPTKYGDFSYGVYVFHWPIVQMFIVAGLFASQPILALALVGAIVAILAVTSWNWIEKPFLRRKRVITQSFPVAPTVQLNV